MNKWSCFNSNDHVSIDIIMIIYNTNIIHLGHVRVEKQVDTQL